MCLRQALSSSPLLWGAYHRIKYVDHLQEHFKLPCTINENGRYNVPNIPDEGYIFRLLFFKNPNHHRPC